ncbi:hypothetical protein BH09MYX1_BH09MYX1_47570 [soil metagenome]
MSAGEAITAPVKPGDVLAGRYRVDRVLAAGGMGVVVAARHVTLDQKVAVKFLLGALSNNTEAGRRFEREAKAAALLRSEHVARVIDVGTLENGAPFLVMEFLDGDDLATILDARGPLPLGEAVEYVIHALEGLSEAHAAQIVHRDLKPSNLFRTHRPDGSPVVKVLDFGISKVDDASQQSVTATSAILGSPLYMSPEQMVSAKTADARSDVWSMGVVLFQLLTGVAPFDGESLPALVLAISARAPKSLRNLRPDAPPQLEAVITKCLAKSRDDRYANVSELATALAPFAPSSALAHIERIQRMGLGSSGRSSAFAIPSVAATASISQSSSGTFGTTKTALAESMSPEQARRPFPFVAIIASVVGTALAITIVLAIKARSDDPKVVPKPDSTTTVVTAGTGATTGATTGIGPAPTASVVVVAPPPSAVPSAKATVVSTRPTLTAKPSASIAAVPPPSSTASTVHAATSASSSTEFSSTRK